MKGINFDFGKFGSLAIVVIVVLSVFTFTGSAAQDSVIFGVNSSSDWTAGTIYNDAWTVSSGSLAVNDSGSYETASIHVSAEESISSVRINVSQINTTNASIQVQLKELNSSTSSFEQVDSVVLTQSQIESGDSAIFGANYGSGEYRIQIVPQFSSGSGIEMQLDALTVTGQTASTSDTTTTTTDDGSDTTTTTMDNQTNTTIPDDDDSAGGGFVPGDGASIGLVVVLVLLAALLAVSKDE